MYGYSLWPVCTHCLYGSSIPPAACLGQICCCVCALQEARMIVCHLHLTMPLQVASLSGRDRSLSASLLELPLDHVLHRLMRCRVSNRPLVNTGRNILASTWMFWTCTCAPCRAMLAAACSVGDRPAAPADAMTSDANAACL